MARFCRRRSATDLQSGFTLIELIVVIVILGILSAVAIPKFANVATDARLAKLQAAKGAMLSAATMYHGRWMIAGGGANSTIDDVNLNDTGYPTNGGMQVAVDLSDYDTSAMTNTGLLSVDARRTTCAVTYIKATGTVSELPAREKCD
jgi:MSHA pilin protein MshA